jgi:hypothetical protein
MAELYSKIKEYAKANGVNEVNFLTDVILEDIGQGAYIAEWNLDITKPTDDQITSYETVANLAEANEIIIETRKSEYGSWESQLDEIYENGLDTWKARIAQVKTDNPKETE